jgi:hypothetical protein
MANILETLALIKSKNATGGAFDSVTNSEAAYARLFYPVLDYCRKNH